MDDDGENRGCDKCGRGPTRRVTATIASAHRGIINQGNPAVGRVMVECRPSPRGARGPTRVNYGEPQHVVALWLTLLSDDVGSFPRPLVPSLPRRHVLGKCACFCAEGILDPPLPPRKGDYRVGAQTTATTCKAIMTDPPTDDTEAREPVAPGTNGAKHRAPLHGHTGEPCAVPASKRRKALESSRGLSTQPIEIGGDSPLDSLHGLSSAQGLSFPPCLLAATIAGS
eukprot:scaffold5017_cov139-Isochrysis_galbana.AAC.4